MIPPAKTQFEHDEDEAKIWSRTEREQAEDKYGEAPDNSHLCGHGLIGRACRFCNPLEDEMSKQKISPCPRCGSEAARRDCGYTTFNPVWVECTSGRCGFRSEGGVSDWNKLAKALADKKPPVKDRRVLSDALARILTKQQLWNLLKGYEPSGRRKTRSF